TRAAAGAPERRGPAAARRRAPRRAAPAAARAAAPLRAARPDRPPGGHNRRALARSPAPQRRVRPPAASTVHREVVRDFDGLLQRQLEATAAQLAEAVPLVHVAHRRVALGLDDLGAQLAGAARARALTREAE